MHGKVDWFQFRETFTTLFPIAFDAGLELEAVTFGRLKMLLMLPSFISITQQAFPFTTWTP